MGREYLSVQAVILKKTDFNENDGIFTFYTAERGKITAIAKGVKKSSSKLRGGLQEFSITNVTMVTGKGLPTVINAETIEPFLQIRYDFKKMSHMVFCMEFIDRVLPEGETEQTTYSLITETMHLIDRGDPWLATFRMIMEFLYGMGYGTQSDTCTLCGKAFGQKGCYGTKEGLICDTCAEKNEERKIQLSIEARTIITALHFFSKENIAQVFYSQQAQKQLNRYMELRMENVLDKPLNSYEFLKIQTKE